MEPDHIHSEGALTNFSKNLTFYTEKTKNKVLKETVLKWIAEIMNWLGKLWREFPPEIDENIIRGFAYVCEGGISYGMETESDSD